MGPALSVVVSHRTREQVDWVLRLLDEKVSSRIEANEHGVADTRAIGGSYFGEPRAFLVDVRVVPGDSNRSDPEFRALSAMAQSDIEFEVDVASMKNRPTDHSILAELAVWLAVKLDGLVDLGGTLDLERPFPGRLENVPYVTADGGRELTHVVDATFLRWWLKQPGFHMIK